MGSPPDEEGRFTDEGPVHTVSLSPFLIAKYETTQAEYAAVMAGHATLSATPSQNVGSAPLSDQRPVETVSWDDLNLTDGFLERTGLVLPSEAQWEYACRAGTSGPYAGNGVLDDMGWYDGNSGGSTHDVGTK
jgi:formylglycine-generating enzyme required for sulfatase activity